MIFTSVVPFRGMTRAGRPEQAKETVPQTAFGGVVHRAAGAGVGGAGAEAARVPGLSQADHHLRVEEGALDAAVAPYGAVEVPVEAVPRRLAS